MSGSAGSSAWQDAFDERLAVTPPVDEEHLKQVPAARGVVLLSAEDDEPIVMLTAADMRSRTRTRLAEPPQSDQPSRSADLRGITRTISFVRCGSHFETDLMFLDLAEQLWPDRYGELVAWKPPWFIELDLASPHPHWKRTRRPMDAPISFGPFPSGASGDRFCDQLIDTFDLCRSLSCLRRSPDGPRCAYAEMGRCVSPSDGTISMDEYRQHLRRAAAFAQGDRAGLAERWTARMRDAAARQAYEEAASAKKRLERLAAFDHPDWRFVRPAERFGFVLAQAGIGVHEFRFFGVWGGQIVPLGPAAYPLGEGVCQGVIDAMRTITAEPIARPDRLGAMRMGLVTRTLLAEGARGGLAVAWSAELTAEDLAEAVEAARDDLGVRGPGGDDESPDQS